MKSRSHEGASQEKVSLIATVRNAGPFIEDFLDSVRTQTRPPDEVVVVDGGSTDGTYERLHQAEGVTAISETGANIARGRNLAIEAATHDVIAVTDADCILAPDWLERIVEPLERGAEVSAGAYLPITRNLVDVCLSAHIPDPSELGPGWLPSARSVAFRRGAFELAGGYPEWLDVGEDMYLNHRWAELGARIEPAPFAVTYWRVRPNLPATWRQYARYAEGDARAGMYTGRHLLRFGTYGAAALVLAMRRKTLLALLVAAGVAYVAPPVRRAWRRTSSAAERAAVPLAVPAMTAFIDAAKMAGYVRGLLKKGR